MREWTGIPVLQNKTMPPLPVAPRVSSVRIATAQWKTKKENRDLPKIHPRISQSLRYFKTEISFWTQNMLEQRGKIFVKTLDRIWAIRRPMWARRAKKHNLIPKKRATGIQGPAPLATKFPVGTEETRTQYKTIKIRVCYIFYIHFSIFIQGAYMQHPL